MKRCGLLAAALFGLWGCNDTSIGGWELTQLTDTPFVADVDDDHITLTEGTAVALRIVIYDDERRLIVPDEDVSFRVEGAGNIVIANGEGHYFLGAGGEGALVGTAECCSGEARIPITTIPQMP
jgi:hypothetical protein